MKIVIKCKICQRELQGTKMTINGLLRDHIRHLHKSEDLLIRDEMRKISELKSHISNIKKRTVEATGYLIPGF